MGSASYGNRSYYVGGCTESAPSSLISMYDASTGIWSTLSYGISTPRCGLASALLGSEAFFAGGFFASTFYATVDVINFMLNTQTTTALSRSRTGVFGTTIGILAFFAGGQNITSTTSVVDIYNSSSTSWSTYSLTNSRAFGSAITFGSQAFFAGGSNFAGTTFDTIDVFNRDINSWSSMSMSLSRSRVVTVSAGDSVLFAGGSTGTANTNIVDIYHTVYKTWSTTSMSVARDWFTGSVIGCKVIFAGGFLYGTSNYYNSIEIFDYISRSWSDLITLSIYASNHYHSATVIGSLLLLVGGQNSVGDSTTNYITYLTFSCTSVGTIITSIGFCSCPLGYYNNGTNCIACIAGTYSNYYATVCSSCPVSYYSNIASSSCTLCYPGIVEIVIYFCNF